MKANLRGLGGIKHLFVMHGEKLGVALFALGALYLIYGAMGRESLPPEKEASQLNQKITLARSNIDSFTVSKYKESAPENFRTVVPLSQTGSTEVPIDGYLTPTSKIAWDSHIVSPVVLRMDPVLLEVQDLETRGGSGLLAFVDPAVRRQKMRELAQKEAERAKKAKEEAAKMSEDPGRGGAGGGRGGRGAEGGGMYGAGDVFDPDHPNRRPVVGMVRPAGVPLQDFEDVRIGHWAIVVAKIPIKEQVKLFHDAFENARGYDPMADLPQYLGYFVERTEIRPGDDSDNLEWKPVSVYDGKSTAPLGPAVTSTVLYGKQDAAANPEQAENLPRFLTRDWVPGLGEIVDSRYLGPGPLVFPLPPLVGRDWGREATHSEIPLAIDNVVLEEEKKAVPEKPGDKADGEQTDLFAGAAGPAGAGGPGVMGGRGGYGMEGGGRGGYAMGGPGGYGGMGRGGYGMEGGGMMGMGRGGYGMEGGGYGGEMGGRGGMGSSVGSGFGPDGNPLVKDWLLRFFDFSVEPGKKYKYRVRLVLLDPNQPSSSRYVDASYLDGSVLKRIKQERKGSKATPYRMTNWSEPSPTVTIPLAGSVSVAGAKPATDQFNSEPKTTLLVQSFGKDAKGNAIQAAEEKDFARGHVANMTSDTEILVDQNRAIDKYKGFKFQTDITVADIRGGERLTRDESRPARVLLMGPAGQLFVQDEISDTEVVATHKAMFAKEPAGGGGFMGGEGGFGRGMMGPEGMGRGR